MCVCVCVCGRGGWGGGGEERGLALSIHSVIIKMSPEASITTAVMSLQC